MLIVINEFHVQPGAEREFETLFGQVLALILREPGCRSCRLHRERGAERTYVSYLEWESEAALTAPHDPAIGALIARYPLEEAPRRRRFDVVSLPGSSQGARALEGRESDPIDELGQISCPTLVMTGERDTGSTPRMARAIHVRIARSRLVIPPRYRHSLLIEATADALR